LSDLEIRPIKVQVMTVTIKGLSRLVTHKWSEKARKMMRDKKLQGRAATKVRELLDMQKECEDATYLLSDGVTAAIPATALKSAIVGAAHKDSGVPKTAIRQALFIRAHETSQEGDLLRVDHASMKMREDCVRVGMDQADLRYRPEFSDWTITFELEYNANVLNEDTIVNLINLAGYSIGVGEGRPEKSELGWGRFQVV